MKSYKLAFTNFDKQNFKSTIEIDENKHKYEN